MNLEEKVELFNEKTGEKFNDFYKKYLPKLIWYCNKYCKDDEKACDYSEEAIMISLEKIDQFDPEKARFSTWLFTIARNHVFQNLKKSNRLKCVSMDLPVDEDGTQISDFISDNIVEDEYNLEQDEIINKKAEILKETIEKLKLPYREVIEMREIKKLSYKEIADKLGEKIEMDISLDKDSNYYKLPSELSKIYEIKDNNNEKVEYKEEIDTIKSPFITKVKISSSGEYKLIGRKPANLSTIKSRIRNGRLKLQEMVEEKFKNIDKQYE